MNTLLISVTFQFSVSVSVATSGKPALKSNCNDCAPGETENLICIMECSAVIRARVMYADPNDSLSLEMMASS